ncbi:hypothetical protein QWA68_015091 [Fusarium oxysporum]|nr:hypothetical protein QWA68_015091 [Fusarium oxysporum]
MISASGKPEDITKGRTILIIGLIVQIAALSLFALNTEFLSRRIAQRKPVMSQAGWQLSHNRFFRTLEGVTLLLVIRSIARSVEFLQGSDGFVISHEIFIYLFDATIVFLAMLALLVIHPGELVGEGIRDKTGYIECSEEVELQSRNG